MRRIRFLIALVLAVSLLLPSITAYLIWGAEATRRAEATAQAIALATAVQQTAQAEAGATVTARARELASAAEATAQAQQTALALTAAALDTTATARAAAAAATATQQAQDLRCRDIGLYALAAITEPIRIQPPPGFVYVSGNPQPRIFATWVVTNTGECPWESVQLVPLRGGDPRTPVLRIDRKEVSRVAPGQAVEVELFINLRDAERVGGRWVIRIDQEWVIRVNDFTLFDRPHLVLKVEPWVVIVTPTPTPTPSPTPTTPPPPTGPPPTETPIPPMPLFSCKWNSAWGPSCGRSSRFLCTELTLPASLPALGHKRQAPFESGSLFGNSHGMVQAAEATERRPPGLQGQANSLRYVRPSL